MPCEGVSCFITITRHGTQSQGFFMGNFASIPTLYNGVQFRSRLEARWAAFFDLCKWEWEYEPIDLNGWIPDFRLVSNVLVEVKPFNTFKDFFELIYQEIENAADKEKYPNILWLGTNIVKDVFSDWGFIGYCGEYRFSFIRPPYKHREYEYAPFLFYPDEKKYGF